MSDEIKTEQQKMIEAFQKRTIDFAASIYHMRMSNRTEMEFLIADQAVIEAETLFPTTEGTDHSPQWIKVKNAVFHIAETVIRDKENRKDIL